MDYIWFWFSKFLVDVGIVTTISVAALILIGINDFLRFIRK